MKKKSVIPVLFVFLCAAAELPAVEEHTVLMKIIQALSAEKRLIEPKMAYDTALLEKKYNYLQWWRPSLTLGNDVVYPYEKDEFDDLVTEDTASLFFSLPLPTGTIIDLSAGYGINRSKILLPEWGFSQSVQGKIGIGQSLNPWWLHSLKNPYTNRAVLQAELARTEYNVALKNILLPCINTYITLRKAERNNGLLIAHIALYDDMITSYRQQLLDGRMSVRDFQDVRKDKWEYEQELLTLEQDITTLQNELYQISGVRAVHIFDEALVAAGNDFWGHIFMGAGKTDIPRLEQRSVEIQQDRLRYEKLITDQSNAPLIKLEFGSSFMLPEKETDNLTGAWEKENFTDNKLNNWSVGITLDLSNMVTPANKKAALERNIRAAALHTLSQKTAAEKEAEKVKNEAVMQLLENHINQLTEIVAGDAALSQDYKLLYDRGGMSELEYRQTELDYKNKCVLLENLRDDLWLRRLFAVFY